MKTTLSTYFLTLLFCCVSFNSQPLKAEMDVSTPAIVAGTLGTVITGACLYKLYQWWNYEESNEELLQNSRTLLNATEHDYATLLSIFEQQSAATLDEHTLSHCAHQLYQYNCYDPSASFACYCCDKIKKQKEKVDDRCCKLLKNNNYDQCALDQLHHISSELMLLHEKLDRLQTIWHNHRHYFDLYYTVQKLSNAYSSDAQALLPSITTPWQFEQLLGSMVSLKSGSFVYFDYADGLKNDIQRLKRYVNAELYLYPLLNKTARKLLQTLSTVHSAIVSSTAYTRDCSAYNAHCL